VTPITATPTPTAPNPASNYVYVSTVAPIPPSTYVFDSNGCYYDSTVNTPAALYPLISTGSVTAT